MKAARALACLGLLGAALCGGALATGHGDAVAAPRGGAPDLEQYRYFRALSLDLVGRLPTRDELAAFEAPGFDLDAWIQGKLDGPAYVERLVRIYMDVLRLEVGPAFLFAPLSTTLRRVQVLGPDGQPTYVFYRVGQRRVPIEIDGEFCLTEAETGLDVPHQGEPTGTPIAVSQRVLDERTTLVKPWWLYRDYLAISPTQRYGAGWDDPDPSYVPLASLRFEPDGKTPTVEVRVCKEEAQTAEVGHIYVGGRPHARKGDPLPPGRRRPPPGDEEYAKAHKGEPLSCRSALARVMSVDCGCGIGLERCLPADSYRTDPHAFVLPARVPLGLSLPIGVSSQPASGWYKFWWSQEAIQFLSYVFAADRDFREVLTARYTRINGPLGQFYLSSAPAACCDLHKIFGMREDEAPLFLPSAVPQGIFPHDVSRWTFIPDRGPRAAGLLTMPAFLAKYASRRARAAALYTAFLCKDFTAAHVELPPSDEPDLMVRPGCASCHATLEPLAAYFSRVEETEWTYLPAENFPIRNPICKLDKDGKIHVNCLPFYDPAFSTREWGMLRGAYASEEHAERGPAGAAADITGRPDFASCAVERVAASFLGRPLRDDDAALLRALRDRFVARGYRMRALVEALVRSPAYARVSGARAAPEGGGLR